ncbi:probable phytol kinase 1, chloroplastic isoform X8 [Phalaenopsis equestris]|nr:probable phytol kinase 1, chloroplastic isoform X8 [Phalaenopsis equestris]
MVSSLIFWRESPVGIISLAMMSGGDGIADIIGRRYGSLKLPHNRRKSWMGSISMFIFGIIFSVMMLYYFSAFGYFHLGWSTVEKVVLISFAATVVESLPLSEVIDDNITVPVTSMVAACLLFGF